MARPSCWRQRHNRHELRNKSCAVFVVSTPSILSQLNRWFLNRQKGLVQRTFVAAPVRRYMVYTLLSHFLREHDADDMIPAWQDVILESVQTLREERASEVFLNNLSQLLASGDVMLASDTKQPEEPRPGSTLIGYRDGQYVYLLPEIAFRAMTRIQPLHFTVSAIGSQLREDGHLLTAGDGKRLTVQIRVRGNRVRVWRLKLEIFGGDTGDSGDSIKNALPEG